ncbi:MAG: hypothetical protein R3F24_04120 [Gammaproteobacteria bacterium]
MQQAVDTLDLDGLTDSRKHCLASGTITQLCGQTSAWMAGYAKEMADLLGPGDFSRQDLRADRAGRTCGTRNFDSQSLVLCCAAAGY